MSWKVLLALGAALLVIVSWTAMRGGASLPATDQATERLVMRQIGHQLLLQAGDSSSRILPVEERANKEYMIRFAETFTFIPDTLVATVRRIIEANGLPSSYRVEMILCNPSAEVIYGFQIFNDSARNIVPCLGRVQEKACYNLLIRFTDTKAAGTGLFSTGLLTGILAAILISLLLRALYLKRKATNKTVNISVKDFYTDTEEPQINPPDLIPEAVHEVATPPGISIGNLLFLPESQQLIAGSSIITLTSKEAKLLNVFARAQQEVIDRDQLMKEVWEDEGVIVGRSLDMFVSKLRKKLQADARISILNVHGKGYKLVIGQMAC